MDKVQAAVDFVNLMTYDFRTSDPIAGHHANLYLHPADEKQRCGRAVRDFLAAGVPAASSSSASVLRPRLGRHSRWGTGLYQPGSRPPIGLTRSTANVDDGTIAGDSCGSGTVRPRRRICGTRKRARSSRTEDPESLRLKGAYILEKGFGRRDVMEVSNNGRRLAGRAVHDFARLEPATRQPEARQAVALIAL